MQCAPMKPDPPVTRTSSPLMPSSGSVGLTPRETASAAACGPGSRPLRGDTSRARSHRCASRGTRSLRRSPRESRPARPKSSRPCRSTRSLRSPAGAPSDPPPGGAACHCPPRLPDLSGSCQDIRHDLSHQRQRALSFLPCENALELHRHVKSRHDGRPGQVVSDVPPSGVQSERGRT